MSRTLERRVTTLCSGSGTPGPCATLLGPAFTRQHTRDSISRNHEKRAAAVWYSFYSRVSKYDADAVFSLMGLLNVTIDPIDLPRSHYYLAATIKLAQLHLSSGGSTYWMCLHGCAGAYQKHYNFTRHVHLYDDRMCTFMRPEPEEMYEHTSSHGKRTNPITPVMGFLDGHGYLHIRIPAVCIPAGSWHHTNARARSTDESFDIWLIAPDGVHHSPRIKLPRSTGTTFALARHGRAHWHIFSAGSCIKLTKVKNPLVEQNYLHWQDTDVCIGGPNPVHDLFTEGREPWQEVNCVFEEGVPVLLPIARRRPLGGGNEEDRRPVGLTAEDVEHLAVYDRDITYEELMSPSTHIYDETEGDKMMEEAEMARLAEHRGRPLFHFSTAMS